MLQYLSADIICSEKWRVFREHKLWCSEEQIMSNDKYPGKNIFAPSWIYSLVFIILQKSSYNPCSFENRPFPSSLVPLFQNESKCETFHMKISFACSFIFMQIKVIFIRMVSRLDSLWNRGARELGNGLLPIGEYHSDIPQFLAWGFSVTWHI